MRARPLKPRAGSGTLVGRSREPVVGQFNCSGLGPLEFKPVHTHIRIMETVVRCNCGAEYRRTEEKFLIPHTGEASCVLCGAILESWRENTHVPSFEIVKFPDGKPEDPSQTP